ncbi:MAG: hypothetical protein ACLR6B_14365 [Blautia sp.]
MEDCANSGIYGELAFSIVDPETANIASLEPGKTTTLRLDHGGRVWGKYSVEESGKYSVKIRGAYHMEIEIDGILYGEAGGLDRDCYLEAGKIYYFRLDKSNFQEEDFDISVDFEKAQKIESLKVTPGTTKYTEHPEGVDRWHFGDWKVRVNFEDGTFDEFDFLDLVKDGEESTNANYITKYNLSVEIYQKDSEDLYADDPYEFDYWAAGEYEVVFKCPEYTTKRFEFQILSKADQTKTVTGLGELKIQNTEPLFANTSYPDDWLEYQVTYKGGLTETVSGTSDNRGNYFEATVSDASGNTYFWGDKLKAGAYTLHVKQEDGEVETTCEFTVVSARDLAGENSVVF